MRLLIAACFSFLSCYLSAQTNGLDSLYQLAQNSSGKQAVILYSKLSINASNTNPDTALFFAKKAIEIAERSDDDDQKLMASLAIGRVLTLKGNYNLCIKYFREALTLAEKQKNDSLTALSLDNIGTSQWQLGKHAEALENLFRSLSIREKINDIHGIAISKSHIGMVYQSQEKLPLAEKYTSEAVAMLKGRYDPALQFSAMHTLANIYGMQGKIKEAFSLDKEGIALAEKTNNDFAKALFYDNMGNCYLYGNPPDYNKAFDHFMKTLLIDSAFANKKQMSDSYTNLGDVFMEQNKYIQAIPYLQRSRILADESGYMQGKLKALQMLSTAYRHSGEPDSALAMLQNAMRAKDSLVNITSESRIAEMQTVYETEKKQQQINLQQAQLSIKNYIIIGIVIVVILLGLLALSALLRFRLNQRARLQNEIMKQRELASKAIIEAEEDERQRIARDLHDGVGQMMSAAKMNLSAFESEIQFNNKSEQEAFEKIIHLVDESCKEVRNVSHNMMPNALLKSNLASAIRDFTDKIEKRSLVIHLYTEGLDEQLDSNLETVLYRVIQECVNNVIKHANASSLDISIIKDHEGISATIEDNGKGFDVSDKEKFEGIGLKNIMTRIEYLKGTVEIDSSPGRGTLIVLNVPMKTTTSEKNL